MGEKGSGDFVASAFHAKIYYMMLFFRIIGGLAIAAVGFLMVWKTTPFQDFTGAIAWAEDKLGPGGTRSFIKILGVIVVFIGIFLSTGLLGEIIISIFSPLFRGLVQT